MKKRRFKRLVYSKFTPGQKRLAKKHGTPAEFGLSCYLLVPDYISMDEADKAIQEYRKEFHAA